MQYAVAVLDWLTKNKEWVFSGLGTAIVIGLLRLIVLLARRRRTVPSSSPAAIAFRAALINAFEGLYPHPVNWPAGTGIDPRLRRVFPALQGAADTFRMALPARKRADFDDAWLTYYSSEKLDGQQSYLHYLNMGGHSTIFGLIVARHKNDGKRNFKENVARLLAFADTL